MGNSGVRLNNKFLRVQTVNQKAILLTALMLLVSATPFVTTSSANEVLEEGRRVRHQGVPLQGLHLPALGLPAALRHGGADEAAGLARRRV